MVESSLNYDELGLKVGLEFHQQLETHKLFCNCPSVIRTDDPDIKVKRRLRAVAGETGEVDMAAAFEAKKEANVLYEGYSDTTCLIELDEEPPSPINEEAVRIALEIAFIFKMRPIDEVQVMRKTIVDGSTPMGFQRTAKVAIGTSDSYLMTSQGKVFITQLYVEEDAARIIEQTKDGTTFRVDRLGIPLIEIRTDPDIHSPEQTKEVAERIGAIIRATGKVKRGLGTIRQDINVSIKNGARVEIKGAQELDLVGEYVKNEVLRQLSMIKIREVLEERGAKEDDIAIEYKDVSTIFAETKAKFVQKALKKGEHVLGVKLSKFGALLGRELQPGRRLGTEFADAVKIYAGLGGILHSDELPNYGISEDEVREVRQVLGCGDEDGFMLVVGLKGKCEQAIWTICNLAKIYITHVPKEVRRPNPDGTTAFLRPLPGSARMYPETDAVPFRISSEMVEEINQHLPELPEEKKTRFIEEYRLSEELADELVLHPNVFWFDKIASSGLGVKPTLVASTVISTSKYLQREGVPFENITEDQFYEIFEFLSQEKFAKEALPEVLESVAKNPDKPLDELVNSIGLTTLSKDEVTNIIKEIIAKNEDLVKERKMDALKPLMGEVMKKARGKIDGKTVSSLLKQLLQEFLS
ncbi:MAG: Glu-tRNA(Gln) amidotransferase subunit GatE [Promethearchaeota archaeon]